MFWSCIYSKDQFRKVWDDSYWKGSRGESFDWHLGCKISTLPMKTWAYHWGLNISAKQYEIWFWKRWKMKLVVWKKLYLSKGWWITIIALFPVYQRAFSCYFPALLVLLIALRNYRRIFLGVAWGRIFNFM